VSEGSPGRSEPRWDRTFLPGPVAVAPEFLRAQAGPIIPHRGPEFRALMEELQEGLREVFRTGRPVYLAPSSGTGFMEAAILNGVRERVLCLVNGAFSARFARIARACGRDVISLEVPLGEVPDPREVAAALARERVDAVTVVHSETSTGALAPLEEIARVVRAEDDVMLLVDGVTSVGAAPVETDRWGLDWICTASQKALALPPGLALGVASPRLLARAASLGRRGLYFDMVEMEKRLEGSETPTTPPVSLLLALRMRLSRIRREGMEAVWSRHADRARLVEAWVAELGRRGSAEVGIVPPEGARSPALTCLRLPPGVQSPRVASELLEAGWRIGGGYGALKHDTLRVGQMGDITESGLAGLLAELERRLVSAASASGA
jgi:aspartate aminotransferase-like enzyme